MERTPLFIVDASVAVKWYVHETDSGRAIKLREQYANGEVDFLAPQLLVYEVGNALRYHPNATRTIGSSALEALRKMQIITEDLEGNVLEEAMQISYSEGITYYDATYLALAKIKGGKFITADEQLVRRVKKNVQYTLLLSEYAE